MVKLHDTPATNGAHLRELQVQLRNVRHQPVSLVWPVYKVIRETFADDRDHDLRAGLEKLYLAAYDSLMSAPVRSAADASILLWYERDNARELPPDAAKHVITWVRKAA
jgi:hypothetical protein